MIHLRCTSAGPQRVFAPSGGVSARPGTRIVDLGSGWVEVSAAGAVTVGIEVAPQGGGAATVGVDARHGASWEVSVDGNRWVAPDGRPGGLTPADMAGEPTVPVEAAHVAEDLWRFPSMVLGVVEIEAASRPTLVLGESLEELDSPAPQELRFELEATGEGRWQTVHEVSGRHVRVSGSEARAVRIRARSRPHPGAGSFACSDPALTDIWHASALTLHLCMQGLVVDGLKRDRMPWSGDQALNTTSNAFAFGDGAIVRDGLVALGRPTHGYVNGISDYSLWWLVNAWQYVLYFGDEGFASEYADHIDGFVARLAAAADGDGLFAPPPQADGFVGSGEGSVFIDWGFAVPDSGPSGALQILWFWALASAVSLLESAHHPSAPSWRGLKDNLERTLRERAWDAAAQRWRTVVGEADGLATAHPNLFAVLSGLDEHPTDAVRAAVLDGEVGTPSCARSRFWHWHAAVSLGRPSWRWGSDGRGCSTEGPAPCGRNSTDPSRGPCTVGRSRRACATRGHRGRPRCFRRSWSACVRAPPDGDPSRSIPISPASTGPPHGCRLLSESSRSSPIDPK